MTRSGIIADLTPEGEFDVYAKPIVPVAGGGALAATGVYAGTGVVLAVVAIIVGAVLVRLVYFRRPRTPRR